MAVLGLSRLGDTLYGTNEFHGRLGGVLILSDTEPIYYTRHEGAEPMSIERLAPATGISVTRTEGIAPIVLTREDGDA